VACVSVALATMPMTALGDREADTKCGGDPAIQGATNAQRQQTTRTRQRHGATRTPRVLPAPPAARGGGPRPTTPGTCTGVDRSSTGDCVAPDLAPDAPQRQQPGRAPAPPATTGPHATR
jgi:hypothetical protein